MSACPFDEAVVELEDWTLLSIIAKRGYSQVNADGDES
jgi:hypothetical protein